MNLILRRISLLLFFFTFFLHSSFAQDFQDIKIKENFSNQQLNLIFLELKINYRINFEYDKKLIEGIRVSAAIPKTKLSNAIPILLEGTGLGFELIPPRTVKITDQPRKQKAEMAVAKPTRNDFSVTGTLKDKDSGETLPFATILVHKTTNGVSANVDGYFTLFNVPTDTTILEVQYLGYQTRLFRLNPSMDINNLKIDMQTSTESLQEVVVSDTKKEQLLKASSGVSRISFSPAQMDKIPTFGEKDIFRSLQLLPGISGSNESSSGLYVRGGTPDQNLILFDGFTVYHVDHLFGFFSAFNANAIKDVQLYKGGFDAKFGGRLSSVVDLTGKDGNSEEFNMGFGVSLVSVNAFAETPFAKGKGSILVAGRRSFQSSFYNNLFESFTGTNEDTNQPPGGFGGRGGQQAVSPNSYFYDLNAKVSYRPSSKDLIALSFYNGQDDLDNSRNTDESALRQRPGGANPDFTFTRESTDLTQWGNWGASAKWSRKWTDRFYTNTHISYSNYYSERDRSNNTTITRNDTTTIRNNGTYEYNDLKDYSFKTDNEWKVSSKNQLEFGAQLTYNDIDYEFTQNDTLEILNRADQGWTNSLYVQDRHTFGEKLILKGGLRATHYSVTDKFYLEPRTSLTYLLSERIKLKGAWSRHNQFATRVVREDIQQGSRDFWLLANDETVPTSFAEHFISGISYETPTLLFDVEAYYKNMDGLSEYSTRLNTTGFGRDRTLNYEELFFSGTGVAKGIEFLLQKKSGKFTGWLGYTLGSVKYDFDAFGEEPFSANQDQTHELKLVGNYTYKKFTFGATFIYATGRPYTAPTGYYELELLDGTTSGFFEVSGKNAVRYPDYHRFDVSATYDMNWGSSKASVGLSIFNVYNRQNIWYKEYDVIEGELLETDVSLLNITPSLFFNWKLR